VKKLRNRWPGFDC